VVIPAETAAKLRFIEVKALQQQGWTRRAVAEHLSLNWRTVNIGLLTTPTRLKGS